MRASRLSVSGTPCAGAGATPVLNHSGLRTVIAGLRGIILAAVIWCAMSGRAADKVPEGFEEAPPRIGSIRWQLLQEQMQREQQKFIIRVPIPDAVTDESAMADAGVSGRSNSGNGPELRPGMAEASRSQAILVGAILVLAGLLVVPRVVPKVVNGLVQRFDPWAPHPGLAAARYANLLAEEQGLKEFMAALKVGPVCSLGTGPGAPSADDSSSTVQASCMVSEFFAFALREIAGMRLALREVNQEGDGNARQRLLRTLADRLCGFKARAARPEVLPVWQMTFALEGMLKQLVERTKTVTPSSLRTLANGVDLLGELCQPGLAPDLATEPPFRFLTVDDDPINLHAISHALSKALPAPDVAHNGEEALALAARESYDVIFLDIQMPGMDGFEVCSRVLEIERNHATPVVFVTGLSDFESRAKSILVGGNDLIAKPFLNFEVAVKALTLALRGRLERSRSPAKTLPATADVPPSVQVPERAPGGDVGPSNLQDLAQPVQTSEVDKLTQPMLTPRSIVPGSGAEGDDLLRTSDDIESALVEGSFFVKAPARFLPLREAAEKMALADAAEHRQELLAELYLRLDAFGPPRGLSELNAAFRLRLALDGLLKKLLADPAAPAASAPQTIVSAVNLLGDLCVPRRNADLAATPPPRILVVDDDALSRRLIVGALQTVFEQPDSAASGEDALVLLEKETFDVVFLDVIMPGMDGFAVCAKLRETSRNGDTPVIFVTGRTDLQARAEFARSGGNEMIAKPFLGAEITLKALTFVLRRRLKKLHFGPAETPASGQPGNEDLSGDGRKASAKEPSRKDRRSGRQKRHIARREARRLIGKSSHLPDYM